ncbi:hypothetical protein A3J13_02140 [Candidatus Daviesbacteria bacterium RIFCSPLOWO2_02_FULL_36_8]|uniref:Glycosyltransferase subfamily 4-like N-terminal domain-containing protein n=1 Tax=Candidatus Daviesbacteria bacterium RIFCSPLOWO2_02_FULL_36_8 TaxID=1797793 RepID=A0A1F5MGW9_9BACT|nr:MAG: hypothetical protein A3J13_02140 [Candidatus Daviesbacteria bacterium RIFCSPLOWO2_02_FULL_36_8]
MKIAFFADTYYPQRNGVATSVGSLASALKKFKNKVYVFAPKIKGFVDNEKDIFRIPSSRMWPTIPDSARLPLPALSPVWMKIVLKDYDLVHAHGNGFFSMLGLVVAKQKNIPFVLTFHTLLNRYAHYILNGKLITPKMADFILKVFANRCDGVITSSEKMKQELIKMGVKKEITVIPNFVNLKKFAVKNQYFLHKNYNIPSNHQIILTVGRLAKEKNIEFIIKTFSKVSRNFKKVHLVIAGEGPQKKHLLNLSINLKLEKKITFTDGIDIDKMPLVYKDADIFVFASTSEVHPMVAIEASASGLPLVLVNDKAYAQEVVNGENGFSLPLNQEEFAQKIILLLKNPLLREKFGKASLKKAKINTDEGMIVKKLMNVYEDCLQKKQ